MASHRRKLVLSDKVVKLADWVALTQRLGRLAVNYGTRSKPNSINLTQRYRHDSTSAV